MKILLVADGRSPITRGWVGVLRQQSWTITLVSTFDCPQVEGVDRQIFIPTAYSGMAGSQAGEQSSGRKRKATGLVRKFRPLFMAIRYWIGPLSLSETRRKLLEIIDTEKPDLVHALRIPFEGMLARVTPKSIPFLVSIWGNDLTLHAKGSLLMARETRLVLNRADGLMADAHRDHQLGEKWGLKPGTPVLCVPGGGGIDLQGMEIAVDSDVAFSPPFPADVPLIINPRGFRPGSVRNDTFFKAIPLVLKEIPDAIFVCAGMAGQPEAEGWIHRLGVEDSVRLLPFLPQKDLWRLFKRAVVSVSISQHDGTPNSLLEAMALGCFPVAGDIESVREWIVDGVNGFLVDPGNPIEAAEMIVKAMKDKRFRDNAAQRNYQLINDLASKPTLNESIKRYYELFELSK